MISLLCPTRARPKQCLRMIESAYETAGCDIEILVARQRDDTTEYDRRIQSMMVPNWSTVMSWNWLATQASGELLMLAADDMYFKTQGWGTDIEEHYNSLGDKRHVYHLRDSRDASGTPHPIVSREWMDCLGYFIPPIFFHWYCDTWTVNQAKETGKFTHLDNFILVHDKPSDTGHGDATHNGIRNAGWPARDKFVNDTCKRFYELEKERLK